MIITSKTIYDRILWQQFAIRQIELSHQVTVISSCRKRISNAIRLFYTQLEAFVFARRINRAYIVVIIIQIELDYKINKLLLLIQINPILFDLYKHDLISSLMEIFSRLFKSSSSQRTKLYRLIVNRSEPLFGWLHENTCPFRNSYSSLLSIN